MAIKPLKTLKFPGLDDTYTVPQPNGYYEEMSTGTSDQLMSTQYTTDSVPYLYRKSGGGVEVGNRMRDKIIGGSVVWNQLVNASASSVTVTSSHKYIAKINDAWSVGASTGTALSVTGGTDMVFDITQMFPTAIADYIYQLEQTTAGAGVSLFRQMFPQDYYEYDAGTMRSVEGLQSHDMVGFNLWDEEWEVGSIKQDGTDATEDNRIRSKNYIPILKGSDYYFTNADSLTIGLRFYDADKNSIGYGAISASTLMQYGGRYLPNGTAYLRFTVIGTATYHNDICINLSDPDKNGTYEPYTKHSYSLDSTVTLRGIPKLVDNNIKWDGDVYDASGVVTRRYGVVDLGTLGWTLNDTSYEYAFFYSNVNARKGGSVNFICSKYTNYGHERNEMTADKEIATWNTVLHKYITIRDSSYTDAAAFKAAMSGVYLVYELATPTTEQAEPYQEVQIVDPYGTEEYVTTGFVPVGHETEYPTDLRSVIEKIADAPSEDGTYTLKATVTDGKVTYEWESIT